jgi:pimeloyl-ACP methyl ester carboxylesterase
MKDVISTTGNYRFQLFGHSMGAPGAVNAAEYIIENKDPDFVESVTVCAGAGAVKDTAHGLGPKAGKMFVQEVFGRWGELESTVGQEHRAAMVREVVSYMLHLQTIKEVIALSHCRMPDSLRRLGDAGVYTDALYFVADGLFAPEEAEAALTGRVANFKVMDDPVYAGHIAPQLYPAHVAKTYDEMQRERTAQVA